MKNLKLKIDSINLLNEYAYSKSMNLYNILKPFGGLRLLNKRGFVSDFDYALNMEPNKTQINTNEGHTLSLRFNIPDYQPGQLVVNFSSCLLEYNGDIVDKPNMLTCTSMLLGSIDGFILKSLFMPTKFEVISLTEIEQQLETYFTIRDSLNKAFSEIAPDIRTFMQIKNNC